jgi:cell division protein FtsN
MLLILAMLFWPTPYRHEEMIVYGNVFLVRTNRFTGSKEYKLATGQWEPMMLSEETGPGDQSSRDDGSDSKQEAKTENDNAGMVPEARDLNQTQTGDQTDDASIFSVQMGVFREQHRARQLYDELIYKGYQARIEEDTLEGDILYRVLIGEFQNEQDAVLFADKLKPDYMYRIVLRPSTKE